MQYRSILILNLGGIGDVLLSTPALRALKAANPDARLEMLVPERVAHFVKRLPYVDVVHTMALGYGGTPGRMFRDAGMLLELRRKRFDLALNMRTLVSEKSAKKIRFLLSVIGAKKTGGRNTDGYGDFFDVQVPERYIGDKYEMEYDIELVKALGYGVDSREVDLPLDERDSSGVSWMLDEAGIGNDKAIVCIHPGGMPSRRWGEEKFAALIDVLALKRRSVFVVTGSEAERELGDRIGPMTGVPVHNFAGRLDVFGMAALLEQCDLFVCGDTGPLHIAAALDVPLVALLGPGDLTRYNPRELSPAAKVLYNKVNCSPCTRVACEHRKCMEHLTVEAVAEVCAGLL